MRWLTGRDGLQRVLCHEMLYVIHNYGIHLLLYTYYYVGWELYIVGSIHPQLHVQEASMRARA